MSDFRKRYNIHKSVLQAARERIAWTFDEFEKVYVSFSGGKDSTVMLHLTMEEAIRRGRQVGVLIIDMEAQYQGTVDHIQACVDLYREHIDLHWVCLPLNLRNAVTNFEPQWTCWDPDQQERWVRDLPADAHPGYDWSSRSSWWSGGTGTAKVSAPQLWSVFGPTNRCIGSGLSSGGTRSRCGRVAGSLPG